MHVAKSLEHSDYEWAVRLSRRSLELVGLWPSEDPDAKSKLFRRLRISVAAVMTTAFYTIPTIGALLKDSPNLVAFINNLGFTLPMLMTVIKIAVMCNKMRVLVPIVNMIAEDWAKPKTIEERNVMIRQAKTGRTINLISYLVMLSTALVIGILPRFGITYRYVTNETDVKKLLIVPTYVAFDLTQSPYFEITMILQWVTLPFIAICYTGVDNLFGVLVFHVCGQLQNLRTRLSNVKKLGNVDRALVNTIRDHVRLIRAVSVIESTYTLMLLLVLLYFGAFICTVGLLVVTVLAEKENFALFRLLYPVAILLNSMLQTSTYCIAGQVLVSEVSTYIQGFHDVRGRVFIRRIADWLVIHECCRVKSEGVHDAAYECEWADLRPSKAKTLILIMARARVPLQVTAGKIFPLTMPTFCNIIKMSASYVSVLLATLW